jgi:hypothetical protein
LGMLPSPRIANTYQSIPNRREESARQKTE